MKLGLHVEKNFNRKNYKNGRNIVFAVINLCKPRKFPANYVCLLPKKINLKAKQQTKFSNMFKEKSKCIAKQLLTQALKDEDECIVRKEIKYRLSLLGLKQMRWTLCLDCGRVLNVERSEVRKYNVCFWCHRKSLSRKY
jgi:hypothetical protein